MSKKKIAQILHSVGGVDVYIRLLLNNIDNTKFCNIVIHGSDDTDKDYSNKLSGTIKDYRMPIHRQIHLLKDLKSLLKIISLLKEESPDIIHAHSAKAGFIGKLAGFITGIPVLYTPHAYSYLSAESKLKSKAYFMLEYLLKYGNNKVLACSKSEQQRAINDVGYKKEDTLLFNNSINQINQIKTLSIEKTWPDNYICSVGRPCFQKNIELMLDVLAEVKNTIKDIHLVLMGVGFHSPNLNIVKEKIKQLDLEENITLLKWTSRDDIFNIINASQLYISTARYEGLPYSVIESLALGKAIVATDTDGNRDLVKNNYNGYLVLNQDKVAFSKSIIKLLNDNATNIKFSENSLKLFNENFDITKNIGRLEEIYINNIK